MTIAIISCCVIFGIFIFFMRGAWKIGHHGGKWFQLIQNETNLLSSLEHSKFATLAQEYCDSFSIDYNGEKKTNIPACEYFSEYTVCNALNVNLKLLDLGASSLVGLGLLGTFVGLTYGINNFDSSNSENIQNSIQSLLNGMGTAFSTSLCGMLFSLVFSFFEKKWRNDLIKNLQHITKKLDAKYYVDDTELVIYKQQQRVEQLGANISIEMRSAVQSLYQQIASLLQYTNADGQDVYIANAIREILLNNQEQTQALKSFSTDLALELNDRLDETLSRQMQQRLIPLMESVDATTKSVVEHIDKMALSVSNPAVDMVERVISDLNANMSKMMREMSATISHNATAELESLARSLGSATQAIGEFPNTMATISEALQLTISEVRSSIAEISNSSAAANSSALKQMQEQIVFATNAISTAIAEVQNVMANITQSSEASSKNVIDKILRSSEQMSAFMQTTVEQLSGAMRASAQAMTTDLVSQQENMLNLHQETTSEVKTVIAELSEAWKLSSEAILAQTEELLSRFDNSIERMNTANTAVSGTMTLMQQAHTSISGTTTHLQTISQAMESASTLFHKRNAEYAQSLEKAQAATERQMREIVGVLEQAGDVTDEYVEKFDIIKHGLGQIFAQIQKGLNDYSQSVSASLKRYLESYSANLTTTTDALSSTIQQQNEMVEILIDTVNNSKRR